MKTCYLHIGPHKTASSTLQTMLADNDDVLKRHGLHYPSISSSERKRHTKFAEEILSGNDSLQRLVLRDALKKAGLPDRIVISAELLGRAVAHADARDRLANFFSELGYTVKIIGYIRPQLLSINSLFAQRLKSLYVLEDFDEYVFRFTTANAYHHLYHYSQLMEDKRFSVEFAPFNGAVLQTGICYDFLNRLDIEASNHGSFAIPKNLNVMVGPKTIVSLLRTARALKNQKITVTNKISWSVVRELRGFARKRQWDAQKFNGLTAKYVEKISSTFSQTNDRFARLAWARPWREIFGEDEDQAVKRPPCIFDWRTAPESERQELRKFTRMALQHVAQLSKKGNPSHEDELAAEAPLRSSIMIAKRQDALGNFRPLRDGEAKMPEGMRR